MEDGWCLLLAGWDGSRLPVAALRLPGWPGLLAPAGGVAPAFDAPLLAPRGARSQSAAPEVLIPPAVTAMHVELRHGRLWALSGGELEAFADGIGTPDPDPRNSVNCVIFMLSYNLVDD